VSILRLTCQRCGIGTPEELGFCASCRLRLHPPSRYDLRFDDFAYEPDKDAIDTLKATGILPYLIKNLTYGRFEQELVEGIRRMSEAPLPQLDEILRDCGDMLSLQILPELFVIERGQANAFTFGTDDSAFVVVDINLLQSLTKQETTVLLAHELGHVKSGHMFYHTLAETLGGGVGLSASLLGFNIISLPIRMGLLSWHRESEVTADRASLLVSNNLKAVESLMTKLASLSRHVPSQAVGSEMTEEPGLLDSVSELFRTHPLYANRYRLIKEFSQSHQFLTARRMIELSRDFRRASLSACRFCGERKPVWESFCPVCGRAQA
jgi:Zn-dependent protease with chaperone function